MALDIEQVLSEARALSEAGKHADARVSLLELLKEAPENQIALLMLGGEYFCSEMFPEAEMVFERLILMDPGAGRFSIALFNTLWKQARRDEALEEIRRFMAAADKVSEQETIAQYVAIIKQLGS